MNCESCPKSCTFAEKFNNRHNGVLLDSVGETNEDCNGPVQVTTRQRAFGLGSRVVRTRVECGLTPPDEVPRWDEKPNTLEFQDPNHATIEGRMVVSTFASTR